MDRPPRPRGNNGATGLHQSTTNLKKRARIHAARQGALRRALGGRSHRRRTGEVRLA